MMYGSGDDDWVVKYYDIAFGITGEHEQAWYLEQVQASGAPVLDLACGTGRLALAFANAGCAVTGLDRSEGMLTRFRARLASAPSVVRARDTAK